MDAAPMDAVAAPMEVPASGDVSMVVAALKAALDVAAADPAMADAMVSNPDVALSTDADGNVVVSCGDASVSATPDQLGGDEPVDLPDGMED